MSPTPNEPLAPVCEARRIQDDLEALSTYRDPDAPGWTRPAFSAVGVAGRQWLEQQMKLAGLTVSRDAANNLIGTLPGAASTNKAIATGSHTDTVNGGGRFDGIIGVLAALEVVRSWRDAGIKLRHDVRVIDFFNEEPNPYGLSCVGSRALAGTLTQEHLGLKNPEGQTLAEGLAEVGGDPQNALNCRWDKEELMAFLELHIEQGPALEKAGLPLAIVTSIAGIHRALIEFTGQADHAGATPMDGRRDSLCAAAEGILEVERLAADGFGVGTAGKIESAPGATNVVPASTKVWVEFRGGSQEWLEACRANLEKALDDISERRDVDVSCRWLSNVAPVPASELIQKTIADAVEQHGHRYTRMFSGAGHDAAHMALLAPMGMIFVPSRGGRSHTPEEWTDPDEIAIGARILSQSILRLDTMDGAGS